MGATPPQGDRNGRRASHQDGNQEIFLSFTVVVAVPILVLWVWQVIQLL